MVISAEGAEVRLQADQMSPYLVYYLKSSTNLLSNHWKTEGFATGVSEAEWVLPITNASGFYKFEERDE